MDDVKRIDSREFREAGYLQEANRLFFHPLGLALEVVIEEDGTEHVGGVWDYRDDPEGMAFADLSGPLVAAKAERVEAERLALAASRRERLGFEIQPIG